jgi:hypothetical protein
MSSQVTRTIGTSLISFFHDNLEPCLRYNPLLSRIQHQRSAHPRVADDFKNTTNKIPTLPAVPPSHDWSSWMLTCALSSPSPASS